MNPVELKIQRMRKGKSIMQMAEALGLTYDGYLRKEQGRVGFSMEQIVIMTEVLELTADLINIIFFDNRLPIGSMEPERRGTA